MLYGRKVLETHEWLNKSNSRRKLRVKDSAFQKKYTLYLIAAIAGSAFVFLIPAWYFVQQNYEIFSALAYKTEPHLLQHLERETLWLKVFFCMTLVFIVSICSYVGYKLTESILGPLISIEKHMKKVTRGDWTQNEFKIRAHDDYRTLADTYSYLYKSLRALTEQDLKLLEKISVEENNFEASMAWNSLVNNKKAQLGIISPTNQSNENGADFSAVPLKRHAS